MDFPARQRLFAALLLVCCGIAGVARADGSGRDGGTTGRDGSAMEGDGSATYVAEDDDGDQDRARDLYNRGTIHSLPEIIRHLSGVVSGEVVGVRLRDRDGRWLYAFTLITGDGRRLYVEVDAGTMEIVGKKPTQ